MKPSLTQYLFASHWPLRVYWLAVTIVSIALAASACQPNLPLFHDWIYSLLFFVCVSLAPVFGFFLSLPFTWVFINPLYHRRAALNGAPYRPGDRIRILAGPYRGHAGRVYDVWHSRNQVRVELDGQISRALPEPFSFTQVCRESNH